MPKPSTLKKNIGLVLAYSIASTALSSEVTIPNTFSAGTPARATEVNQNFEAVKNSVNDNFSKITTATSRLDALDSSVTSLESSVISQDNRLTTVEQTLSTVGGGSPLRVLSGNTFVGFFAFLQTPTSAWLLSDQGYFFSLDLGDGNSFLREMRVYFDGPNCSGNSFATNDGIEEWIVRQGVAFRPFSGGAPSNQVFYTPNGGSPSQKNFASSLNGVNCVLETGSVLAFDAFLNDENVTGVSNSPPQWPFNFGVP